MENSDAIQAGYRVEPPGLPRRVVFMAAACAAGVALAYLLPAAVAWQRASLVMFAVSFLAGLSTLWSP
jgi:hypothetical protein